MPPATDRMSISLQLAPLQLGLASSPGYPTHMRVAVKTTARFGFPDFKAPYSEIELYGIPQKGPGDHDVDRYPYKLQVCLYTLLS